MGAGWKIGSAVSGRSELPLAAMAARPITAIVRLLLTQGTLIGPLAERGRRAGAPRWWEKRRARRAADEWIAAGWARVWPGASTSSPPAASDGCSHDRSAGPSPISRRAA